VASAARHGDANGFAEESVHCDGVVQREPALGWVSGGSFAWAQSGNDVFLNFTASTVHEPTGVAIGLLCLGVATLRDAGFQWVVALRGGFGFIEDIAWPNLRTFSITKS